MEGGKIRRNLSCIGDVGCRPTQVRLVVLLQRVLGFRLFHLISVRVHTIAVREKQCRCTIDNLCLNYHPKSIAVSAGSQVGQY